MRFLKLTNIVPNSMVYVFDEINSCVLFLKRIRGNHTNVIIPDNYYTENLLIRIRHANIETGRFYRTLDLRIAVKKDDPMHYPIVIIQELDL